ncbi:MAG: cell division protein FtsZ [Rikenellaceae bacterium]|nr:cell division protein FtsZ [Rikenellaceae bacterium]
MTVDSLIEFDIEKVSPSIIMVAGVGGGGSNAVNHMFELGIADVTFMVCNTDKQALARSPVPIKVKLGEHLTEGLGAGNNPERGRAAALESLDEIAEILKREGTKMIFITAGMGGGTGTGAAPVIAKAAKELGILTVGIVTLPFKTEGKKRAAHAMKGIEELRGQVDSLLVINNENIQEIYGKLPLTDAFGKADDILATAAKGIAEIITRDGVVNVDFADVKTVMSNSGVALMGSGRASGEDRAMKVADLALSSPLLDHNYIAGATNILINITSGDDEITLEETCQITEYIQERAGNEANIIWGAGNNTQLGSDIEVTIIATGFDVVTSDADTAQGARLDERTRSGLQFVNRKGRFVPPSDRTQANPFLRHGEAPAAAGAGTGDKPSYGNAPKASEQQIVSGTRVAINLDKIENEPAYVRRKVKFIKERPDEPGTRSSKVVLKQDAQPEEKPQTNVSLFD